MKLDEAILIAQGEPDRAKLALFGANPDDPGALDKLQARLMAEDATAKEKRRAEGKDTSGPIARFTKGTLGATLMYRNVPQAAKYIRGRATLYHGTNPDSLQSILKNEAGAGLKTEFAGTQGRLNAELIPNHVMTNALQTGEQFTEGELQLMQTRLGDYIATPELRRGKKLPELVRQEAERMLASKSIDPARKKQIADKIVSGLSDRGMRIYAGEHPSQVATWSKPGNEGEKIIQGFAAGQVDHPAAMAVDVFTGGGLSAVQDITSRSKYKPTSVENVSFSDPEFLERIKKNYPGVKATKAETVQDVIANSLNDIIKKVAPDANEKTYQAVIGFQTPTAELSNLKDFPVLRRYVQVNPGLQATLKKVPGFETYEPGRDMSLPHDISNKNFKTLDFIDETGEKVHRFVNKDFEAPSLTMRQRLRSLGRGALPLGLAAFGADLAQSAVTGNRTYTARGAEALWKKLLGNKKDGQSQETKQAAIARFSPVKDTAKAMGKYIIPGMAFTTGAGLLAGHAALQSIPLSEKETDDKAPAFEKALERATQDLKRSAIAEMGLGIVMPAAGGIVGSMLPATDIKGRILKGALGTLGGAMASLPARTVYQNYIDAKRGNSVLAENVGVNKKQIQDNAALISALPTALGGSAIMGSGVYGYKKYYPGFGLKANDPAHLLGAINSRVGSPNKAIEMGKEIRDALHHPSRVMDAADARIMLKQVAAAPAHVGEEDLERSLAFIKNHQPEGELPWTGINIPTGAYEGTIGGAEPIRAIKTQHRYLRDQKLQSRLDEEKIPRVYRSEYGNPGGFASDYIGSRNRKPLLIEEDLPRLGSMSLVVPEQNARGISVEPFYAGHTPGSRPVALRDSEHSFSLDPTAAGRYSKMLQREAKGRQLLTSGASDFELLSELDDAGMPDASYLRMKLFHADGSPERYPPEAAKRKLTEFKEKIMSSAPPSPAPAPQPVAPPAPQPTASRRSSRFRPATPPPSAGRAAVPPSAPEGEGLGIDEKAIQGILDQARNNPAIQDLAKLLRDQKTTELTLEDSGLSEAFSQLLAQLPKANS